MKTTEPANRMKDRHVVMLPSSGKPPTDLMAEMLVARMASVQSIKKFPPAVSIRVLRG